VAGGCRHLGKAGMKYLDMSDEFRERLAVCCRLAWRHEFFDERIPRLRQQRKGMGCVFKASAGADQGDSSDFVEMVAVLIGLSCCCEEFAENIKDPILFRKWKRTGDPRP